MFLLLYKVILAILGLLFFHIKLTIVLSRSVKNCTWVLMGIVLKLFIAFGNIAIFTMLILPKQVHGKSFHFLVSSLNSFFRDSKFLCYRSFTFFVSVPPRVFMLFVAIVKGDASLISFSSNVSSIYSRATDFLG